MAEFWNGVSIPYERERIFRQAGSSSPDKLKLNITVSIPYERERIFRHTPFSTQTGRGSATPKTKHELRGAFFSRKYTPKIGQTLINTKPNTNFLSKTA